MTIGKQIRTSTLEYGKLAPNFDLASTDGQSYTRSQYRGKSGLVLIFFENTTEALALLKTIALDREEYRELNSHIFAIGHTSRESLTQLASGLPFTVLADPDSTAWKAYSSSDEPGYGV